MKPIISLVAIVGASARTVSFHSFCRHVRQRGRTSSRSTSSRSAIRATCRTPIQIRPARCRKVPDRQVRNQRANDRQGERPGRARDHERHCAGWITRRRASRGTKRRSSSTGSTRARGACRRTSSMRAVTFSYGRRSIRDTTQIIFTATAWRSTSCPAKTSGTKRRITIQSREPITTIPREAIRPGRNRFHR